MELLEKQQLFTQGQGAFNHIVFLSTQNLLQLSCRKLSFKGGTSHSKCSNYSSLYVQYKVILDMAIQKCFNVATKSEAEPE